VWCVVVAAGSGARFGAAKQFLDLRGSRVIDRSVAAAAAVCDGVVVVLAPEVLGTDDAEVPGATTVVAGGATRSQSSRAGVHAVPATAEAILVHDAARPLASSDLFRRVVAAVRQGAEAVVPVVLITDTVREVGGTVVDRSSLRAVQTPQGFAAQALRTAVESGADATDDAGLVEAGGAAVVLVEGDPLNRKLTTIEDLAVAEALLRAQEEQ
jgi:2-C-methyl-D-erythritol 4-phosphate cytidylyltransferase